MYLSVNSYRRQLPLAFSSIAFSSFPPKNSLSNVILWLLKLLYIPGIALCLMLSFFYLRGHDYTRELFLIKLSPLENITIGFLFVYSIAGQLLLLYTSFGAPSASQRRQARWLLLGIGAGTFPLAILTTVPRLWDVSIPYAGYSAYTICLIPICYVIAIIRHRLMIIELIINRSVVYMLVSGFALGIYLLSIQGLTMFFHTAARSRTVTAVSVLIAAVLFAPAKTRIQKLIDRAFDREAYNYRQTLFDAEPDALLNSRSGNSGRYAAPPSYESHPYQSWSCDVSRIRLL